MIENLFIMVIIFVIGSAFGSFLSVAIGRTLKGKKGIFLGKSECPKCRHHLTTVDLIPIISWVFRRGRCAYCHKAISIEYPTLELLSGLLFISNYTSLLTTTGNFDLAEPPTNTVVFWIKMAYLCLISVSLLSICFSDLKTKTIPNIFLTIWIILCVPAFLAGPASLASALPDHLIALAIALIFFGSQYLLSRGRWLGSGDIFIAAGMGPLLGWQKLVLAIVLSYFVGAIIGIILLLTRRQKAGSAIAFGPFLVMGTLISLYFGNQIISWYLSTLII